MVTASRSRWSTPIPIWARWSTSRSRWSPNTHKWTRWSHLKVQAINPNPYGPDGRLKVQVTQYPYGPQMVPIPYGPDYKSVEIPSSTRSGGHHEVQVVSPGPGGQPWSNGQLRVQAVPQRSRRQPQAQAVSLKAQEVSLKAQAGQPQGQADSLKAQAVNLKARRSASSTEVTSQYIHQ
ncbi:hypothetical protein AVEN_40609-1 [Araneus ventricosus]|uniref:Uncharacterized protein n=1 Tax=Araneus ventricosus TaxID=182803 RepID=A0A4Y2JBV8_ARAVE|nr:hypothetical protein AVEN_40609-1 [Araneus ventricosus]